MKTLHTGEDVIERLRHAQAFPDDTTTVTLLETHISWVLLTDRFVYKIKKPVRFEFLDFSTLELRHEACRLEQELNQRLAPQVYLGVLPVTRDSRGRVAIQGEGEVIEWAVRMRRLPATAALDQRLGSGELAPHELRRLAEFLCQFYDRQPPVQVMTDEYHRAVLQHVRANREELLRPDHELDAARVLRVHAAQLQFLHLQQELLDNRVRDGRIVEGHGDLRPEHIYLTPTPMVIDCIEFSPELRRLDVIDELGFLAMECDRLGAPDVGHQLLHYYQEAAQDPISPPLLAFYKSYRAAVRAKVSILRSAQLTGASRAEVRREAEEYLKLADGYVRDLYPPLVLLVHGRSGVGKSTVAETLADMLGLEHLQTDVLRREMFFHNGKAALPPAELYTAENRQRVYDLLAERAERRLREGVSLVLDGTFLSGALRESFRRMASALGATWLAIHCTCPLEVARERIAQRLESGPHVSEARPDLPAQQQEKEDLAAGAWSDQTAGTQATCELDTRSSMPEMVQQVLNALREPTGHISHVH